MLARLLHGAAVGRGGAVVLHGGPGIGKTALLDVALGRMPRVQVVRADGAEFEMELPYAALHQLFAPVLDRRAPLPEPQRVTLETVFGLRDAPAPDQFRVGLAVLGLLAETAQRAPLVCVVDDAQWVDVSSRHALAFAARRIGAEHVAMIFVARDTEAVPELAGLPQVQVGALADAEARAVLAAAVDTPLDAEIRDRIVAEAQGNPLALLELRREAGRVELAGGYGGVAAGPVAGMVEQTFARRVARLPQDAQALLVLAAAEPLGDPVLLDRSAVAIGIGSGAATSVEAAGLLDLGARVRFRHPLARSAVYCTASAAQRRRCHAALAEATDPATDPDRRAWHRALSRHDRDEETAAELERSADRARARGGLVAAAAFLERAAELTPDPARRAGRALAAAWLQHLAGASADVLELLERAEAGPLDGPGRAAARLLRARAEFQRTRDAEATAALLAAASGLDADRARETYLEAVASAMFIERAPGALVALAKKVRDQAPDRSPPRPVDLLLDALLSQLVLRDGAAAPAMSRAVGAVLEQAEDPRGMELAVLMALDLHDDEAAVRIAERQVALARRQGALALLAPALRYQAIALTGDGRLSDAAACVAEARAVDEATGSADMVFSDLLLSAWRGDVARFDAMVAVLRARVGRLELVTELYASAVLHNGTGAYERAYAAASRAHEQDLGGAYMLWHLAPELVEAAARLGRRDSAADALRLVEDRARASGTDWALGNARRCAALLAEGPDAEAVHREAIALLERSRARPFLGRARLAYGEWLRRERRRSEARAELRAAHELLSAVGADAFAERAARELQATGEHARKRTSDLADALTPQERLIARRVADGATSKEVAAALFLSPRTIDAHLRNIFSKLGVTSRRQLRDMPF